MGSGPESTRFLLQQLQCRPRTFRWSLPRTVLLRRGDNQKLGFHFKTFVYPDNSETVTVVVRVKDDCRIDSGSLHVLDRIVGISHVQVTDLDEASIKQVFSQSQEPVVQLQVSAMSRADPSSQVKRFLSINSGASGSSVTASVDSGERPQVKRFQKSNSTETSPLPPVSPAADLRSSSSSSLSQRGAVDTPPVRRRPPCTARECGVSHRPGFPLHSPHLSHHPHQHYSLPDRMEGDIVLPDDIVLLCEADGPNSLPPVLTPLPNTPTPSSLTQPAGGGSVFVSTVSTGIGGALSVSGGSESSLPAGGSAAQQQQQQPSRSLGVEVCRAPGCSVQRTCLWHRFVLTYPQYVVWEAVTKTVELQKGDSDNFGFKYKVKKYDGPPAEVFALVTEVMSGGVAWTLLLSGDWIRSINGTPVNSPKEAFRPDFRKLSSLRLMIQRPEGLSQKGIPKLKVLAESLGINLHIPASVPTDAAAAAPQSRPLPDNRPVPPANHNSRYLDRQTVPGVEDISSRAVGARDHTLFDPLLDQYPRQAQSPGEHIPLSTLSRPALVRSRSLLDRCVLPQVRVVVCGAHGSAAEFVRGLLGENSGMDVDPEAPVQSFQLSLQRNAHLGTYVHPKRECLTALIKEYETYVYGAGECAQEVGSGLRCMNMELYVINDEQFFDHCCTWLLPSASLLVLTFQVHRLLNQPQVETRRLATMVRTFQACTDGGGGDIPASQVLLYGVPSGSQQDMSAEEVQVMFYVTDSGSHLLQQHGLAVNVASPTCSRNMAATRQALFSACRAHLSQTPAPQCVARVVDSLCAASGVKMFGGEVVSLVKRVVGEGDPGVVQSVISSLLHSGCLVPCGTGRASREAEQQQQDYLLPFNTFQALSSLLIKPLLDTHTTESRQKWFRLMTTGRVPRSELVELLALEASCLTVDILEQLGIVFAFQPSSTNGRGDSGFAEDSKSEFVIPYFLQDARERECETEGFVLRFERPVLWRDYYDMLCKLSALPATQEVAMQGQGRCVVRHNGLWLSLRWRKDSGWDGIFVAVCRLHGSRESATVQELERLFSFVIPASVPFKLQVLDVSSPSSHLPSTLPQPAASPAARLYSDAPIHDETFVKPVVDAAADSSLPLQEGGAYDNLPLTVLPWSVLNQAAILLTVIMPTGHDWRSVAELAGKSMAEIYAYEAISSREVPAMNFLREWMLTGTVQQFLDILESLERPDVRDLILTFLRERRGS